MAVRAALALCRSRFSPSPTLIPRRGLAADAAGRDHGYQKVNMKYLMSPSEWSEKHCILASLSLWGLLFYKGYKHFSELDEKQKKLDKKYERDKVRFERNKEQRRSGKFF